ncbi:MAG: tyrosine-type recombinase/integrase, partial [Acidobacteriota bacterium]
TERLRITQRKTSTPLLFPLTEAVGDSLADYILRGRPAVNCREVFVRHRAPAGPLKATGVAEAFQSWSRRSGLTIPFQGAHCLRHSFAVHLLRQGISVKAIGDLLGHRNAESTSVYLRMAVEDLREVALELPSSTDAEMKP